MLYAPDPFPAYRLSKEEYEDLEGEFAEACFNDPSSNLDWSDLRAHTSTVRAEEQAGFAAALAHHLCQGDELRVLVYHSPAQGGYRLPKKEIKGFLGQVWVGPADLFLFDEDFRWSISLTHHKELLLQIVKANVQT